MMSSESEDIRVEVDADSDGALSVKSQRTGVMR